MSGTLVLAGVDADLAGKSWGEAVDVFLSASVDSPSTRRNYGFALRRAFAAMGVATLDQVTPYHLARYRESVMSTAEWSPGTKRLNIAAVRSFLRWTRAFGLHAISGDVVDIALRVPAAKTLVPYTILSEREIAALLAVAKRPRDLAMLHVMLGAGLRVSEVSALAIRDLVSADPPYVIVREGKGGHTRSVPVRPEVLSSLRAISNGRGGDEPVFRTARGPAGRLHAPGLRERLATLGRQAGISRPVTPHMLRHSYAMRSLVYAGNVVAVSKLLGHRQLSTTQRYVEHLEQGSLVACVPPLPTADDAV